MQSYYLFFGYQIDRILSNELNKINPEIKSFFIKNGSDYLHQITHNDKEYLGKLITPPSEISSLELTEANIVSLLKKLVPSFIPKKNYLLLIPILAEKF